MVNAQELEAQRQRFGLEAETIIIGIQSNAVNNPPRVVDENIAVDEIILPYRQPIAPRGRAQHPIGMIYVEDDLDLDGAGATGAIVLPTLPPGVIFKITNTMIQLLNLKDMFMGAVDNNETETVPIRGEATKLLNEMPDDLIKTWIELKKAFLERFFPKSKELQMKDEISAHKQLPGEAMHETWWRFSQKLKNVWRIIYEEAILREHATNGRAEQRKREEERDQDMAHMRTQIDILTKHIVAKSERVTILEMQVGTTKEKDSMIGQQTESRETGRKEMGTEMIAVVCMFPRMKGDFSSMRQLVDSHTTSIKQIKQQLGQLSASLNYRKNGSLPSDTIQIPNKDGNCMAIATRSFITMLRQLSVNIPLLEALEQIPGYAKFMKDLVTKKRAKKENPGAFTIPCTIGSIKFVKAVSDLRTSINLMPLAIYKQLKLGVPKPTTMRLMLADRSVERHVGILCDVLVKVDTFMFPADFVILDCEVILRFPLFRKTISGHRTSIGR
ncbi:hypothetical protein KY285_026608 [Solanum tuberosum]|nr:hypothetical protein KY285_026608 [Solanum tuberosum]